MLKTLAIRNLAVIQTLECEFGSGLNVFTGETGAGKSILLDALGLALGDRADSDLVRSGAERADITAVFAVDRVPALGRLLAERGLDADAECIVQRQIRADGGSRAYCNGTPITVQILKEIGDLLIDIHGQHEHQSLLRRPVHRQMLDEYGGLDAILAPLRAAYARWSECREELRALRGPSDRHELERNFLQYQVDELAALVPNPDELISLQQQHQKLAHTTRLAEVCASQRAALDDDDGGLLSQLAHLQTELRDASRYAPELSQVAELLNGAEAHLHEASRQMRDFDDSLDSDPAAMAEIERRLGTLHDLARKHQVDIAGLNETLSRARQRLEEVIGAESRIAELNATMQRALDEYRRIAKDLSARRQETAARLSTVTTEHLRTLGMPSGRFEVIVRGELDADPGPSGDDECEFLVTTNPDQAPRPLAKVASGGELSRISLAIRVAVAGASGVPVLVYDEVDAGIGGAVAEIVAQRLRELSRQRQVLCITHLPQVACYGDHHYVVTKTVRDGATSTAVTALGAEQRIGEIARMLGGVSVTPTTIRHAEEMLARV